jgi:hypothetical protein
LLKAIDSYIDTNLQDLLDSKIIKQIEALKLQLIANNNLINEQQEAEKAALMHILEINKNILDIMSKIDKPNS